MRGLVKRAYHDTNRLFKRHVVPSVVAAVVLASVYWVAARHVHTLRPDVAPAASAAVVTVGTAALAWLAAFLISLVRAPLAIENDRLRPGPEAQKAEQERLRSIRESVGLTQRDVNDLRETVALIQAKGTYWDRRIEDLKMDWFPGTGGQLAGEPLTKRAFEACDDLRREVGKLNRLVHDRWWADTRDTELDPSYVVHEPRVEAGDLEAFKDAVTRASHELDKAMEALQGG